jgi:hypothetical protein
VVGASRFIAGVLVLLASGPARGQTPGAAKAEGTALPLPTERWTGDLDQMMKRRFIRVLVAHSKTFFLVDRATPRGTS